MVAGEIISQGSPGEVKADMKGSLYEVEVDHPDRALAILRKKFGASRVSLFGDRLHVVVENDEQKRQAGAVLQEAGVRVVAEKPVQFSLEDVFISLIESRRSEIPL
jgi:ABC-2 type transport system ATP-binding protein